MSARRKLSALWVVVLLAALALTLVTIAPFRQVLSADRQVELTEQKLDALEAENARLDDMVARLQTDSEVERLARERFGLVREGEVGYVVDWVEVEAQPATTLPPRDDRRWWDRAWDFVSGSDAGSGD